MPSRLLMTIQLLGDRKSSNELVFNFPSHGGTCKSLETWVKKAGITKHITFSLCKAFIWN